LKVGGVKSWTIYCAGKSGAERSKTVLIMEEGKGEHTRQGGLWEQNQLSQKTTRQEERAGFKQATESVRVNF